ncbi:MAG: metallopeptidase TldD-related protein [Micromonosporaceae bacterium]|jgi:predicted Zn-dependent protease
MTAQLDLAQQVLDLVRTVGGTQLEAEVSVDRTVTALTRFANSFIHQNVADDTTTVRLGVHAEGRTAAGSTTLTSPEGLRDLVTRTCEAVRVSPPDPGWPGLAPPEPLRGQGGYDEATAEASPQERAARVRAFVDAAGGLETAGYCRTSSWHGAYANSAGQAVAASTTDAAMDAIARLDGSDGVARQASVRLADLDGSVLGARAAAKARAGTSPVELPPGRYEVVLEPCAVADLLSNLAAWGFNGRLHAERRSFVELGADQFDPSVTLVDDPFAPDGPGAAFDAEGTPKRRLVLADAGTTVAVTHDRRTAAMAGGGARSTGHALPGERPFGAVACNLRLLPAGGADTGGAGEPDGVADPSAAGLVGRVERGLLVTDLWYTRVLDPKTLVMTGLTRNGVWLIEDGKVTTPVQNLRFTQSYPQALGPGAVKGVGPVASLQPSGWGVLWWSAPALHLASWNFTGGASG